MIVERNEIELEFKDLMPGDVFCFDLTDPTVYMKTTEIKRQDGVVVNLVEVKTGELGWESSRCGVVKLDHTLVIK